MPPRLETTKFATKEGVDKVVSRVFGPRKRGVSYGLGFSPIVLAKEDFEGRKEAMAFLLLLFWKRKTLRGGMETKAFLLLFWQRKTLRGGRETKVSLLLFWQEKTLRVRKEAKVPRIVVGCVR